MNTPTIRSLTYYPVKGCAGVQVTSAEVTETGLLHDRAFMLVHEEDGTFVSQRTTPGMAVVRVEVVDDGKRLALDAPGAGPFGTPVVLDGPRREVSLFGRPQGEAVDQGDEAADWFSDVLGARLRLVRVRPGFDRDGWAEEDGTPGKVAFADAHAVLVLSQASLDGLNERIVERGGEPVPMDRFRPNVVVAGWPEPHTEDRVRRMTAGGVDLGYAVKCMRCSVPLVDQETGRTAGPEPIRTLAGYRREERYDGKVSFGMKAAVLRPGTVSVGDEVRAVEWAARPN